MVVVPLIEPSDPQSMPLVLKRMFAALPRMLNKLNPAEVIVVCAPLLKLPYKPVRSIHIPAPAVELVGGGEPKARAAVAPLKISIPVLLIFEVPIVHPPIDPVVAVIVPVIVALLANKVPAGVTRKGAEARPA